MDTKFWGPSGWKLLHTIAFTYDTKDKAAIKEFFELIPFVLPCKFCRASLTEYMDEDPLDVSSRDALARWLWRIHNKVNDKLRGQGLLKIKNPSFDTVAKMYSEHEVFEGWDFLCSIAENHPYSKFTKSLPMEGCPSKESLLCEKDKNRWNTMTPDERFNKYVDFWKILGKVLPEPWRDSWNSCKLNSKALDTRVTWVRELWRIRCCMEKPDECYQEMCKRVARHRSGCGKKRRARTCRRTRGTRSLKNTSNSKSKK
jgi:hypothetical protein